MSETYRHPYEGGAEVDWANESRGYFERERLILDYLEKVTSQPELEQKLHLEYILKKNADTEYLRKHEMDGASDVETFRRCIPVVDYEAFRDSIDRIANGDKSPILSADPPREVLISSGTTGGDPKLFPVNGEDLRFRGLMQSFIAPTLNRVMPILREGKILNLVFLRAGSQTPGGLPARTAGTSFIYNHGLQLFRTVPKLSSSPKEVFLTPDTNSAMYSHLLCALLHRYEIRRVRANFATLFVRVLRFLQDNWTAILEDIDEGTLNKTMVQDENVRAAMLPLLLARGADWRAELASSLRKDCSCENGMIRADGIIRRLWPNCEVIDTGGTGVMKAYLPSLLRYSDNMRIICTSLYAASEGFFGLNMDPSRPPEETFYVLIPTIAYYEFVAIGAPERSSEFTGGSNSKGHRTGDKDEDALIRDANATGASAEEQVFDLVSLKVGQQYEIIVTTISGFCRLRMGDILEVVGSYNKSPLFKFVRRKNILLSVDRDKTDEEELQAAVTRAALILEKEIPTLRIADYTSYTQYEHPGHYVIVWELRSTSAPGTYTGDVPSGVLDKCCLALEASLNFVYRRGRYEGIVGPLELNLVLPGTFDLLCEYAVSRGASINQYKVPRGLSLKQAPLREIVMGRVHQRHFSSTRPPFTPSTYKMKQAPAAK